MDRQQEGFDEEYEPEDIDAVTDDRYGITD